MGLYGWVMESSLGPIATTADIQRFGKWKKEIQDTLKELEERHKGKKMTKVQFGKKKASIRKELRILHKKTKKQAKDWELINKLKEDLEKLETEYKETHMRKNEYEQRKKELKKKLKKADELLEKSEERFKKFTEKEVRL